MLVSGVVSVVSGSLLNRGNWEQDREQDRELSTRNMGKDINSEDWREERDSREYFEYRVEW